MAKKAPPPPTKRKVVPEDIPPPYRKSSGGLPAGAIERRRKNDKERQAKALEARLMGYTWLQVSEIAGYSSKEAAYRAVKSVLKSIPAPEVEEYRAVTIARLEELHKTYRELALSGDVKAAEILLKTIDRVIRVTGMDINQARAAGALEQNAEAALIASLDKQKYVHATYVAFTKAGLTPEQQDIAIQALEDELSVVGVPDNTVSGEVV